MTPSEAQARKIVRDYLVSVDHRLLSPDCVQDLSRDFLAEQVREILAGDRRVPANNASANTHMWVMGRAREGDSHCHSVIMKVALDAVKGGKPVPEYIRAYFVAACEGRRPTMTRGRKGGTTHSRDLILAEAVRRITEPRIGITGAGAHAIVHEILHQLREELRDGLRAPTTGTIKKACSGFPTA